MNFNKFEDYEDYEDYETEYKNQNENDDLNKFVVYYNSDGNLLGGAGYLLDIPLIQSIDNPFKKGGGKKNKNKNNEHPDELNNKNPVYVIPAGLYYKEIESVQSYSPDSFNYKERNVIDDKLYDELYDLATFKFDTSEETNTNKNVTKKNKTKKNDNEKNNLNKKSKNKKTKKINKK